MKFTREDVFRAVVVGMLAAVLYLTAPAKIRPDPCTGSDMKAWIAQARLRGLSLPDFEHKERER